MSDSTTLFSRGSQKDLRLAEDFQTSRSSSQVTKHLEISDMLPAEVGSEGPKLPGNAGLTHMYHFQAPTGADTEKPDSLRMQQPQDFSA